MKTRLADVLVPERFPIPALGEALDFMRLLWEVDHALQRISKGMEATLGITGPQRLVIRIVGRFPGITAGHLAKILHVHPSTLTGILRRLEERGLVRRRADPKDGRRSLFGLTEQGQKFNIEKEGTLEAAIKKMLVSTPPREIQAARKVLASIAATLGSLDGDTDS